MQRRTSYDFDHLMRSYVGQLFFFFFWQRSLISAQLSRAELYSKRSSANAMQCLRRRLRPSPGRVPELQEPQVTEYDWVSDESTRFDMQRPAHAFSFHASFNTTLSLKRMDGGQDTATCNASAYYFTQPVPVFKGMRLVLKAGSSVLLFQIGVSRRRPMAN
jgi:hypothetical protein